MVNHKSTNHSEHLNNQPITHTKLFTHNQLTNQPTNHSHSQPTNTNSLIPIHNQPSLAGSTCHSFAFTTNQPSIHPSIHPTDRPTDRPTSQPTNQPTNPLPCCRAEVTIPSDRLAGGDHNGGLHRFLAATKQFYEWYFPSIRLSVCHTFLAATKQLYKWYFPSVRLSVCPSVCHTFLTMFPSSYHHEIFRSYYQWPK